MTAMSTIAIDDVCTEADLEQEVGGSAVLQSLIPSEWSGSAQKAREDALDDVVRALRRRTPPIREADLADVTELKMAVKFGALERLYRLAMTTSGSVHAEHRRLYSDRFSDEVNGLSPTLTDDTRGAVMSIAFHRR